MDPKIIFLKVSDNASKAKALYQNVHTHFLEGQTILILSPSEEASRYIDELLWKFPEESFLPHEKAVDDIKIPIAITTLPKNVNQASILFNLTATISPITDQFSIVYDLLDQTNEERYKASLKRYQAYKSERFTHVHCPE